MRDDANPIALRAVRHILDAARPLTLKVAGVDVTCAVSRAPAREQTTAGVEGIDPSRDGPWPDAVLVECRWPDGGVDLRVDGWFWTAQGRYRHDVVLRVSRGRRELVWVNVNASIDAAGEAATAVVRAKASTFTRKVETDESMGPRRNAALRELLSSSGLPVLSSSTVSLCEVEVPSGAIVGGGEKAFERLLHLSLLKLEFVDRGQDAGDRGAPLIDLEKLGLSPGQIPPDEGEGGQGDVHEEDDDEDEDGERDDTVAARPRQYWAGGCDSPERRKEFVQDNRWAMNWSRTTVKKAGLRAWEHFNRIRPGDWFAIKGMGGRHDLMIYYVGEVTEVDAEHGRLKLRPLDVKLYGGKGPEGPGAANWQATLVPVARPDIIEQVFGVRFGVRPPAAAGGPLNRILFGPPGTGKTYALRQFYMPKYIRAGQAGPDENLTEELTWFEAIALAMHSLGGAASVDSLVEHPLLVAKHALQGRRGSLRHVLWGTLGHHTVKSSKTVKMTRRTGDLIFDKRPDGQWHLADDLPEGLEEMAARLNRPSSAKVRHDFAFVTFHQAYSYEDFIEGIRPRISVDGDEDGKLGYTLEGGVFMRAAREAVRLTGFAGSLEEFCALSPAERTKRLDGAPTYALFIDEINRGNVARVFGELITLLEEDKRLGAVNELIVLLPYSRRPFGVPSNLHIIGTMNTADRGVDALDAALRRRFEFEELPPQPELLDATVVEGEIEIGRMLRTINHRLEVLVDRDRCVGHAYFLPLREKPTLDHLKHIFRRRILPLLDEYFFGDRGKIGLVLGKDFVTRRDPGQVELAAFDHPDRDALGERATWDLRRTEDLSSLAFRRIYDASVDPA